MESSRDFTFGNQSRDQTPVVKYAIGRPVVDDVDELS